MYGVLQSVFGSVEALPSLLDVGAGQPAARLRLTITLLLCQRQRVLEYLVRFAPLLVVSEGARQQTLRCPVAVKGEHCRSTQRIDSGIPLVARKGKTPAFAIDFGAPVRVIG